MEKNQQNLNNMLVGLLPQILAKQDVIMAMIARNSSSDKEAQNLVLNEAMTAYKSLKQDYQEKLTELYLK